MTRVERFNHFIFDYSNINNFLSDFTKNQDIKQLDENFQKLKNYPPWQYVNNFLKKDLIFQMTDHFFNLMQEGIKQNKAKKTNNDYLFKAFKGASNHFEFKLEEIYFPINTILKKIPHEKNYCHNNYLKKIENTINNSLILNKNLDSNLKNFLEEIKASKNSYDLLNAGNEYLNLNYNLYEPIYNLLDLCCSISRIY